MSLKVFIFIVYKDLSGLQSHHLMVSACVSADDVMFYTTGPCAESVSLQAVALQSRDSGHKPFALSTFNYRDILLFQSFQKFNVDVKLCKKSSVLCS